MYYLFVIGKALALLIPRKLAYWLADIIGRIRYYYAVRDRRTVIKSLSPLIKDQSKLEDAARNVFINFGYYLIDFVSYRKMNKKFFERYVSVHGLEKYKEACSLKKGVIILSAHLGNYEFAAAVANSLGENISAVALPHKDPRLKKFFDNQRNVFGVKSIPTGLSVKKCLKILKSGGHVAFVGDRVFADKGLEVEVLSKKAILPNGPQFFAAATGAVIMPMFLIRRDKYYYDLIFDEPIYCPQDKDRVQVQVILMEKFAEVLGKYIKKYPEQWYMFGKFWAD